MGPFHEAVTWGKICPAGWQATQWDIHNKEKSCLADGNRFVFGGCCILLSSSITGFLPCDGIMQRAHWDTFLLPTKSLAKEATSVPAIWVLYLHAATLVLIALITFISGFNT